MCRSTSSTVLYGCIHLRTDATFLIWTLSRNRSHKSFNFTIILNAIRSQCMHILYSALKDVFRMYRELLWNCGESGIAMRLLHTRIPKSAHSADKQHSMTPLCLCIARKCCRCWIIATGCEYYEYSTK